MKRTVIGAEEAFRLLTDKKHRESVRNAADACLQLVLQSGDVREAEPHDKGRAL